MVSFVSLVAQLRLSSNLVVWQCVGPPKKTEIVDRCSKDSSLFLRLPSEIERSVMPRSMCVVLSCFLPPSLPISVYADALAGVRQEEDQHKSFLLSKFLP